jgi:hypothetical protein
VHAGENPVRPRAWRRRPAPLTWLPQLRGGGQYDGPCDTDLHLIGNTKTEARRKLGFDF